MDLIKDAARFPFFAIKKETSSTICLAKFHESTIWLYTGQLASCHHTPFTKLGTTVDTFFNPQTRRDQQQQMLANQRPNECAYCWRLEDNALLSDRYKKSMEYKTVNDVDDYKNPNYVFKPKTLELAFSNTCNLACSYCSPQFSSSWEKDLKLNGVYVDLPTDLRQHYTRGIDQHHAAVDMNLFWRWFDTVSDGIESIRITGGEPLLHEETFAIFEKMIAINPNVEIVVHTNLCQKYVIIERLIKNIAKFKNVRLNISNESAGDVAEFLRDGMDYAEWLSNVKCIANANVEASISTSVTPISLLSLDQLYRDIIAIRNESAGKVYIAVNFVSFPEFQSLNVLTREERELYQAHYTTFFQSINSDILPVEHSHIQRLLTMLSPDLTHNQQSELRQDSANFFKQYCFRRNKKINYEHYIGQVNIK